MIDACPWVDPLFAFATIIQTKPHSCLCGFFVAEPPAQRVRRLPAALPDSTC
jgi:hypothetical protein